MEDLRHRRGRMRRLVGLVLAGIVLNLHPAIPAQASGTFTRYTFSNPPSYTRDYWVYVPSTYTGDRTVPLLVALHGCSQNGPDLARGSKFNHLAEEKGFIVVYPEQRVTSYPSGNPSGCWNWYDAPNQRRGLAEPSTIAGLTQTVMSTWQIDRRRVFVFGASAGGAMAVNMGVTYPDLYAAVGSLAGCSYPDCSANGYPAYQEMGPRARVVPVLAATGDLDPLQPGTEAVVQQWLDTNDWADDGASNGSISRLPAWTEHRTAAAGDGNGYTYSIDHYAAGPNSCPLIDKYVVNGLGHAWPYGDPSGSFTDTRGPDIRRALYEFFMDHPMPPAGRIDSCVAPVAVDDEAETTQSEPVAIDVLANDNDEDGDQLTVFSVTQPEGGTVVVNGGADVTFTSDPGFSGTTAFAYTVGDGDGIDDTSNGGTATATVTVVVHDVTAPDPPEVIAPVEGTHTASALQAVSGTAEPGSTVTVSEDDRVLAVAEAGGDGSWAVTLAFEEGPHRLVVTATDAAGNTSDPTVRSFTVDLTPPDAPAIITPGEKGRMSNPVLISGAAEAHVRVYVTEGTTSLGVADADSGGLWSLSATLSRGNHQITAAAEDRAGNKGPDSPARTFRVT